MALQGPQKIAILLCRFSDSPTAEPNPSGYYEDLVTRGSGGLNDYWIAASLGAINLDGSRVFGWKTFDLTRAAFLAAHPGRWDKIKGAIDRFPEMSEAEYTCVVALYAVDVTDGGSQGGVLGGPGDGNVTFLAHELGHIFGLEHSFDRSERQAETWSQPGEYFDRHDMMSAMNVDSDAGHRFSPRGPLLNAPNIDRMGWLPAQRVWQPAGNSSATHDVDLVALEHPEVSGYLAARIGPWMAEFRMATRFDAGLSQPCILFHQAEAAPNSVILASDPAHNVHEWLPGQSIGQISSYRLFGGKRVTVVSFDLRARKARLRVQIVAKKPPFVDFDTTFEGGVGLLPQNGGLVVIRNGKIVVVPVPVPEPIDLRETIRQQVQEAVQAALPPQVLGFQTGSRRPGLPSLAVGPRGPSKG